MDYRPKKGLDIWLNDKGFYRKHVAMDETCFFRAVSDQVYNTQIYHEDIRKLCVNFATKNRELFKDLLSDSEWYEHIDKLKKHFVVCGDIEINIASKLFKRDFIIVDASNFTSNNVTDNGYEILITLCKMRDNHYDSVCAKEHIENSGFCQSLIYKLLYEKIYDFDNVDDIVQTMLYPNDESQKNSNLFDSIVPAEFEDKGDICKNPPFPYKVAKALDPNQYRNIEFDAWNQTRKELRLQDWYLGGEDFKAGTKCLLVVENNTFECYIQELVYHGKEDVCLVYVVEWASKEIVKREELMPLPDAKPWPLPYAISRNSKTENLPAEIVEEPKPASKKRRNKRRPTNNNNNSASRNDNNNNTRSTVDCYEGCPLVAFPNNQYVDENFNIPAIYNEETNFSEHCSAPYEPLLHLPCDPNYSVPYESNSNNSDEDYSNNEDSFVTETDWSNYETWLSSEGTPTSCCAPLPYPTPYVMPSTYLPNVNPQMYVATHQYNTMIHQEHANSKVTTLCTKYIEKTFLNNNSLPNLNQVPLIPWPNYSEYKPQMSGLNNPEYEQQMMPGQNFSAYEPEMVPNYPQVMPGTEYPKYEREMMSGPMMSVPPNTPVSPGPVALPIYPPPLGPVTAVCPCYLVINPVPVPQPNVTIPQPNMLTSENFANLYIKCDCSSGGVGPCQPVNLCPPECFREYKEHS